MNEELRNRFCSENDIHIKDLKPQSIVFKYYTYWLENKLGMCYENKSKDYKTKLKSFLIGLECNNIDDIVNNFDDIKIKEFGESIVKITKQKINNKTKTNGTQKN